MGVCPESVMKQACCLLQRGVLIVGRPLVGCAISWRSWRSKASCTVIEASAAIADNCGGVGRVARLVVVWSIWRWVVLPISN